jgi:hypothetical protein
MTVPPVPINLLATRTLIDTNVFMQLEDGGLINDPWSLWIGRADILVLKQDNVVQGLQAAPTCVLKDHGSLVRSN